MAFDILSFIAGVAAGALLGVLAAMFHSLEATADLQERVRILSRDVEGLQSRVSAQKIGEPGSDSNAELDQLRRNIREIHEEIKKMYRKTSR